MANATMAGLGSYLAGVMIETATDTTDSPPAVEAIPNNHRKAMWIIAMGSCAKGTILYADLSEQLQ